MDTGEVRKRLLQAIDQAKRTIAAHRAEADLASRQYEPFLETTAAPVFRQVSDALKAEGHGFQVYTPAGSVRLASDRSADDFVELALDTARSPVALIARTNLARGRRVVTSERVIHEGPDLERVTDERVLAVLLEEVVPMITR